MICRKCGQELQPLDYNCPRCGTLIERTMQQRAGAAVYRRELAPHEKAPGSHRGSFLLAMASVGFLLGFVGVGLPLLLLTWVLAGRDLERTRAGALDASGEDILTVTRTLSAVGLCVSVIALVVLATLEYPRLRTFMDGRYVSVPSVRDGDRKTSANEALAYVGPEIGDTKVRIQASVSSAGRLTVGDLANRALKRITEENPGVNPTITPWSVPDVPVKAMSYSYTVGGRETVVYKVFVVYSAKALVFTVEVPPEDRDAAMHELRKAVFRWREYIRLLG